MVIMDIRIDNFYQFKNFHMNMSYPKKIVDATIEAEHLAGLPNFRYKKVNIIMGANASGKTSLGRLLMKFTNDFSDQNYIHILCPDITQYCSDPVPEPKFPLSSSDPMWSTANILRLTVLPHRSLQK